MMTRGRYMPGVGVVSNDKPSWDVLVNALQTDHVVVHLDGESTVHEIMKEATACIGERLRW